MKIKIREFAILSPSQALSDMLRRGHFLFTVKEDRCNIFNINFATAKQLAARYGQRPFIFVRMDEEQVVGQYWKRPNHCAPISKHNDYKLANEQKTIIEIWWYGDFMLPFNNKIGWRFPLEALYRLNTQFEDMDDNLLMLARERVGIGGLRTRQEVYKGISCEGDDLLPFEYYTYYCEEGYFMSWRWHPEETGLPVIIWIDEDYAFERYNHPLWIYFVNGYDEESRLAPIVVCEEPYLPYDTSLKITNEDFEILKTFVRTFRKELQAVAEREMEIEDFQKFIEEDYYYLLHPYKEVKDAGYGFTIVRNKEGLLNYVNSERELLSEKWFYQAFPFKSRKGEVYVYAIADAGDKQHWEPYKLYTNGEIKVFEDA